MRRRIRSGRGGARNIERIRVLRWLLRWLLAMRRSILRAAGLMRGLFSLYGFNQEENLEARIKVKRKLLFRLKEKEDF